MNTDSLVIAGKAYTSRLLVGTGKYKDFAQTPKRTSSLNSMHPGVGTASS